MLALRAIFWVLIKATDFAHGLRTDACIDPLHGVIFQNKKNVCATRHFCSGLIEATNFAHGLRADD